MEWGDGYCRGGTLPPTVRICTVPERRSLKKTGALAPVLKFLSCFSSAQAPYPSFLPKAAKTRSFRCVSSSHRTRFAGLRREPCFVLRRAEKAPANPPESGLESLSGAGTLPRPEGGHTAAHRGEHGGSSACSANFCCTCCRSAAISARYSWCWVSHSIASWIGRMW